MDIETYNVLLKRKADAQSELLEINHQSFDLKIRRARAEKIIDQVDFEIYKVNGGNLGRELVGKADAMAEGDLLVKNRMLHTNEISEHDITGHR